MGPAFCGRRRKRPPRTAWMDGGFAPLFGAVGAGLGGIRPVGVGLWEQPKLGRRFPARAHSLAWAYKAQHLDFDAGLSPRKVLSARHGPALASMTCSPGCLPVRALKPAVVSGRPAGVGDRWDVRFRGPQ